MYHVVFSVICLYYYYYCICTSQIIKYFTYNLCKIPLVIDWFKGGMLNSLFLVLNFCWSFYADVSLILQNDAMRIRKIYSRKLMRALAQQSYITAYRNTHGDNSWTIPWNLYRNGVLMTKVYTMRTFKRPRLRQICREWIEVCGSSVWMGEELLAATPQPRRKATEVWEMLMFQLYISIICISYQYRYHMNCRQKTSPVVA